MILIGPFITTLSHNINGSWIWLIGINRLFFTLDSLQEILLVLWRKGPHTIGLFRKAGNAKRQKEIREQLNSGAEVDLKDEHVILLCDLLKVILQVFKRF